MKTGPLVEKGEWGVGVTSLGNNILGKMSETGMVGGSRGWLTSAAPASCLAFAATRLPGGASLLLRQ